MCAEQRALRYEPGNLLRDSDRVSLCELLDRILNKGVVAVGHVTISVAGVDLIYLGLEVVLSSVQPQYDNCAPAGATLRWNA